MKSCALPFSSPIEVLKNPDAAALYVRREYPLAESVTVVVTNRDFVSFDVHLVPYRELTDDLYPTEIVRISLFSDGRIFAVPLGAARTWKHRFVDSFTHLCLWYTHDPAVLKWDWPKGLLDYTSIVHRHLLAEEYCRRTGEWPAEDAPHGHPAEGAHPVKSLGLRLRLSGTFQ
jgi:hypothetical protein